MSDSPSLPVSASTPNNSASANAITISPVAASGAVAVNTFGNTLMEEIGAAKLLSTEKLLKDTLLPLTDSGEDGASLISDGNETTQIGNIMPPQIEVIPLTPLNTPAPTIHAATNTHSASLQTVLKQAGILPGDELEKNFKAGEFQSGAIEPNIFNLTKLQSSPDLNAKLLPVTFDATVQSSISTYLKQAENLFSPIKIINEPQNTIDSFTSIFTSTPTVGSTSVASSSPGGSSVNNPNQLSTQTSIYSQGWGDEIGQKILWMVKNDMQSAELRINPPHLGPIEVRISVNNDQTSVQFTSQHGPVRDTLEAAAPRLKELFTEGGLNLVNVDISQHSFAGQRDQQKFNSYDAPIDSNSAFSLADTENKEESTTVIVRGIVDFFA